MNDNWVILHTYFKYQEVVGAYQVNNSPPPKVSLPDRGGES